MPAVARIGDRINTGHGCHTTAPIAQGSSDVFVNGIGLAFQGAAIVFHLVPCGNSCCGHGAVINAGSSSVFVNGIAVARVHDSADRGAVADGSPNVFANEAWDGSPPTEGDGDGEPGDDPGIGDTGGGSSSISIDDVVSIIGPDDSGLDYGTRWNPHNPDHVAQMANGIKDNDQDLHEMSGGVRPMKTDAEYVAAGRLEVINYGVARGELDSDGNPI